MRIGLPFLKKKQQETPVVKRERPAQDKLYVISGRGLHMYDVVGEPIIKGDNVGLQIRYADIVWASARNKEMQEFLRDRGRRSRGDPRDRMRPRSRA